MKLLLFGWCSLFVLLGFLAPSIFPTPGSFPYEAQLKMYEPFFLQPLAHFDGIHYLLISENGYAQYEQAFFPLYPLLIYLLSQYLFGGHSIVAGVLISFLSFIGGMYVFKKYLQELMKKDTSIWWTLLFFLLFPTSFFLNAVYTEGLFFLLSIGTFYFIHKKNWVLAGICAFFASLTRLIGIFLIIPFALIILRRWQEGKKLQGYFILLFAPVVGLATYCLYLWQTTGDPLYFMHVQWAFGAQRSNNLISIPQVLYRYAKIVVTSDWNIPYFISLCELFLFIGAGAILVFQLVQLWRKKQLLSELAGLVYFSSASLILPTLTGTLSSVPRYALLSVSIFIALGSIKKLWIKLLIGFLFLILHIMLFSLYVRGYFVS
ncbi:hypothetical protein HGA88_00045 [Candidatus Roizmanbacteria bacterium]|nr:hypothetical protein [Candidatus Roizmanbacteria bacterium]